jgi:hypothetical protein
MMSRDMTRLEWKKDQLWRGCILAAIAHAIMVAHYPEQSNEHSWDGINYSVQDSAGTRGTITFNSQYCVAAFRNDKSERVNISEGLKEANHYFDGAPEEILRLAQEETLQYLLDNVKGKTIPLITTAFWGTNDNLITGDTFENMYENGVFLLETQTMNFDESVEAWKEYYDMSLQQTNLLLSIYKRKVDNPKEVLMLTKEEVDLIGSDDEDGLNESRDSFEEMGIKWEE